jgi:hypothetical protein
MRRMAPAKSVRPGGKRASQAILVRLEAEQRLQRPLGQDQAGSDIGGSPVCVGSDHRQYANAATSPPTISIPRARPAPTSNSRSTMASTPFTTRKIPPAINPLTTLTVPLSIEPILLLQSADSQPSNPEVCDVSRRTHRNWWSARVATSSQRCRTLPKFVCAPPRFKASRARINGTVGAFCVKRIASAWRRARLWMLHRGIARTGAARSRGATAHMASTTCVECTSNDGRRLAIPVRPSRKRYPVKGTVRTVEIHRFRRRVCVAPATRRLDSSMPPVLSDHRGRTVHQARRDEGPVQWSLLPTSRWPGPRCSVEPPARPAQEALESNHRWRALPAGSDGSQPLRAPLLAFQEGPRHGCPRARFDSEADV